MRRGEILVSVRATCEAVLARRGLELVAFSLGREGRRQVLRLTVDGPEGAPGVDEMAEASEEISRALDDAEDPIPGRYDLELESPGIERPLVRPSDYRRFAGSRAKVRFQLPEQDRRTFTGTILSAGEESFVLEAEGGPVTIPYEAVERARLVVDWDEELKGLGSLDRGRRERRA